MDVNSRCGTSVPAPASLAEEDLMVGANNVTSEIIANSVLAFSTSATDGVEPDQPARLMRQVTRHE